MSFKGHLIDWDEMSKYSNVDTELYELTDRQAAILLSTTDYLGWSTRWYNLPPSANLGELKSDIDLRLMTGVTPVIDCNEVEQCLLTSPTIAAINAAIAQNSADIVSNAADISQNTADIAQNSADIATNLASINQNSADIALQGVLISDNAAQIVINTADIAQNSADNALQDVLISDNAAQITALDLAVQSNINEINDLWTESNNQDTRITALENSGGGGGGGVLKVVESSGVSNLSVHSTGSGAWSDVGGVFEFNSTLNGSGVTFASFSLIAWNNFALNQESGSFRISVNDTYYSNEVQLRSKDGQNVDPMFISGVFDDLPSGVSVFKLQFRTTGGTLEIRPSWVSMEMFEISSGSISTDATVDFDGGYAYTDIVGNITNNGNPNNCISQTNQSFGSTIVEFELDVTGKTISNIELDMYRTGGNISTTLYLDNVSIGGITTPTWTLDTWITTLWSDHQSIFPLAAGSTLRFKVVSTQNGAGARVDNFRIFF